MSQTKTLVMVWWLSQGRSPEGVAQSERTPKMVSDMVSGFREAKGMDTMYIHVRIDADS